MQETPGIHAATTADTMVQLQKEMHDLFLACKQVRLGVESGNTAATTSLSTPEQQEASSSSQQGHGTSIQFKAWGPRQFIGSVKQIMKARHEFRKRIEVKPATFCTTDPLFCFAFASCDGADRVTCDGFCWHSTLQSPQEVIPAVGFCRGLWEWHTRANPTRCLGQLAASMCLSEQRVR